VYSLRAQTPEIEITTKNNTEREKATAELLKKTLAEYDLSKWIFTNKIIIEEKVIPHSHPVLTLNTSSRDKKDILTSLIHEQLHWYLDKYPDRIDKAVAEFKKRYKNVPYQNRAGAKDEYSTYMHLINCYLEFRIMATLIGDEEARQLMWNQSFYTWVYNKIIEEQDFVGKVVSDAGFDLIK
jgi:hypothetical protein